jgi:excisionase family DNA binding protein
MSDDRLARDNRLARKKPVRWWIGGRPKVAMSMVYPGEKFLRTSDVAKMLHVSPKTVSRWAKEGRIPHLSTLGGHRRFPATEIERLMDELSGRREGPASQVG